MNHYYLVETSVLLLLLYIFSYAINDYGTGQWVGLTGRCSVPTKPLAAKCIFSRPVGQLSQTFFLSVLNNALVPMVSSKCATCK